MIKVLLADDHPVFREGLKAIISKTPDISIAAEAPAEHDISHQLAKDKFDLLILDISMSDWAGWDILRELRWETSAPPILVVTAYPEERYGIRALKAGASGYVSKNSSPEQLLAAVRRVDQGGKHISATLAEKLAQELNHDFERPPHETLSDREYQVMRMLAYGKTVTEIARELSLSVKTISTNRTRILHKMKMEKTAEIVRYTIKRGIVD